MNTHRRWGLCKWILCISASYWVAGSPVAAGDLDEIRQELAGLKRRVEALEAENRRLKQEIDVERLVVRKELVVSDTGAPWEKGFEDHQIPRGLYARSLWDGPGGLWVRSRLIKGEIDDPFDDRFHALNRDGSPFRAPGHISWNVWLGGAWRQMCIIQGEGLEYTELPIQEWTGTSHPGRLRFQSFRPEHGEPLTDVLMGQGKLAVGGGGYGGGGLPYPTEALEVWGGEVRQFALVPPETPRIVSDDGSGAHSYSLIAVGPQGRRSAVSTSAASRGLAKLSWDSVPGADAYVVLRDGSEVSGLLRIEGSRKEWQDPAANR